jgi:citrate lyase subunit beta/citryl-CoA lyase
LLSMTEAGVDKMYDLKERPKDKPSGVLATPEIFDAVTKSKYNSEIRTVFLPLGIIEKLDENAPAIANLPSLGRHGDALALFLNLDEFMVGLAKHAFKRDHLVIVTSANKAGTGNCYTLSDIHPEIRDAVEFKIDGGTSLYKKERGEFENITTTMVDLINNQFIRPGAFEKNLLEVTASLGFIHPNEMVIRSRQRGEMQFRSALFLRTFSEKTYQKIRGLDHPDWLILDLEDGCPQPQKEKARTLIQFNIQTRLFEGKHVAIRLNELDQMDELVKDLGIKFTSRITAFILPMLRTAEDIETYERLIVSAELELGLPRKTFKFIPLIETAEGVLNAESIAKASDRNIALIFGHADLFSELFSERNQQNLHWARFKVLSAARAAGIKLFDTPYENTNDYKGLLQDCRSARDLGIDGKIALHFDQIDPINRIFGISKEIRDQYQNIVDAFEGGCQIVDGKFLGAPIVKRMKRELNRPVYVSKSALNEGVSGRTLTYGFDHKKVFVGKIIASPMEITVDDSWTASWHALVPTLNPLETSKPYARQLGLEKQLMPYHLLINLALCMLVECYSESCIYHLSVEDVIYDKAVYSGDTLRTILIIDHVRETSKGLSSVVETRVVMINQHDERVLTMKRKSLFPPIETIDKPTSYENEFAEYFDSRPNQRLGKKLIRNAQKIRRERRFELQRFEQNELILHSLVRPVGLSTSVAYSNLFKNTHPLHINNSRYSTEELAVSGGFVMPIIIGAAQRDFKETIHERIVETMHINPVNHEESLGAFSYILQSKRSGEIEELTIRTFGIKNTDIERDLAGMKIPLTLLRTDEIKPSEVEKICRQECPELASLICMRIDWKLWRKIGA